MDFLDPSVIPSLPPPGGMISHSELMGRPRIILDQSRSLSDPRPLAHSHALFAPAVELPERGPYVLPKQYLATPGSSSDTTLNLPLPGSLGRKGAVKRAISLDDRQKRARLGAKTTELSNIAQGPEDDKTLVRAMSKDRQVKRKPSPGPPRRKLVKSMLGHGRTMSDTTDTLKVHLQAHTRRASTVPPQIRQVPEPARHSTLAIFASEGTIRLGTDADLPQASALLDTLQSLSPPSRVIGAAPPASMGLLRPPTLLVPLAIVLEALVVERSVLRDEYPSDAERLPALKDGSLLQVASGEGELDWDVLKVYTLELGSIINRILPFLQNASSSEVEVLAKGLRMYVGKMKKVFAEIAMMYVEGYSFLRGFWEEDGMKGTAGEVGRWGDLFDA